MPITFVTGTPGAGKSLYSVSELLPQFLAEKLDGPNGPVVRSLYINGIRDLLIEHEVMDAPSFLDWDSFKDDWSKQINDREPGQPPLDVPKRLDNWWLWVMPGDVLVVDECQRIFKPMAPGRRVPAFISKLEIHRHYGIDLLVISQSPLLVHRHIRDLSGRHLHVRRWWFNKCLVYEFDRVASLSSFKGANKTSVWTRNKKAYALYKSAEIHTKPGMGTPLYLVLVLLAFVLLPYFVYRAFDRSAQWTKQGQGVHDDSGLSFSPRPVGSASGVQSLPAVSASSVPVEDERFLSLVRGRKTAPREIAGCVRWGSPSRCDCVTETGRFIPSGALCEAVMQGDIDLYPRPRSERAVDSGTQAVNQAPGRPVQPSGASPGA